MICKIKFNTWNNLKKWYFASHSSLFGHLSIRNWKIEKFCRVNIVRTPSPFLKGGGGGGRDLKNFKNEVEPPYELWLNVYLILRFIYAQKPKVSLRRISCPSRIASPNIKKGLSRRKYGSTKSTSTSYFMGIGCLFPKQCRVSHNAANWTLFQVVNLRNALHFILEGCVFSISVVLEQYR